MNIQTIFSLLKTENLSRTKKGYSVILSSRMFSLLIPLYEDDLHCILIDFLGCGRSDRTASFPSVIWIDEARQVVSLAQHLELEKDKRWSMMPQ